MISTVEKVLFLKSQDLFSQIASEDLATIARITDEIRLEEGDEICREGEPGDTLFLIVQGQVRVHKLERELARLGTGDIVGEMSLLDSEPRSATVTCLSDTTLLRIGRDDFNEILGEQLDIALGIIKVLTRRHRETIADLRDASAKLKSLQKTEV